jgi:AraC-like DNA-binding protein
VPRDAGPLGHPSLQNPTRAVNKTFEAKPLSSRWLTMSGPGDVRIGPILSIPGALTELGVKPQLAFAQAGVDSGLFQNLDSRMRYEAVGRLFDVCVALTGCPHFGLLVGERFELKSFGALGYLMRNCATVGEAIRSLVLHLHLYDRGAAPVLLTPDSSFVTLGYSIYRHDTPAAAHVYDAAIAIAYKMLRELCGPSWKPVRVQFSHSRPRSVAPYRRLFRSTVSFDAGISAIVFASSWLRRPIEGADAALHAILANAIRTAKANGPMSFSDQVEGVLHQLVLSGTASAGAVAHLFAIHERTLRRRLAEEGTGLHQLVNRTRFELAQQLLRNTGLPVSEIAAALQYADPNAFSRAFRNWAELSPTQWRARH